MIITELRAQNYRSFATEMRYRPREGINTIVGENNVGKSNILKILQDIIESLNNLNVDNPQSYQNNDEDFFLTCKCQLNDSDFDILLPLFSLTPKYFDEFKEIFGTRIEIHYQFSKVNGQSLEIIMGDWVFVDNRLLYGQRTDSGYHAESWERLAHRVNNEEDVLRNAILDVIDKSEPNSPTPYILQSRKPIREFFAKLFEQKTISFPEFRERSTSKVQENLFSSPQGNQVASVLHNLKNGDMKQRSKFKKIQEHFEEIFPNLHLDINQGEIVIVKSGEHEVGLDSIGAGIVEIIILLTHLIGIKNHVIILDEPELHLHPHAKRLVSQLIKEASKENQIISVTHSTHFIFTERLYQITLVRDEKGTSTLTDMPHNILSNEEFNRIQRLTESEQKEFFFARVVLLVEGDTEKGAIPIFLRNIGFDLDLYNISIISLDSHDFALFSKLLRGFKIPHVVLLDFDTIENIVASISFEGKKIRTSSLLYQLDDLGLLSENEKKVVKECEGRIISKSKDKFVYNDSAFEKLAPIIRNHDFIRLLSTDFEGLFSSKENKEILRKAKKEFKSNKVLVGMHFAESVEISKELYVNMAKLGELVGLPFDPHGL